MIVKIISFLLLFAGYYEHCKQTTGVQWCYWFFAIMLPHLPNMFDDFMNGDEHIRREYTIGGLLLLSIPMAFALLE